MLDTFINVVYWALIIAEVALMVAEFTRGR